MVKKIVFHLGDPKTGSTSIQDTLVTQNWTCADKKILFPAKINHIPLAQSISKKGSAKARAQQFESVKKQINDSDADIAVISAEDFEQVDPEDLKAAVQEFFPDHADTARYIAYVRPHADRLVSAYGERIRAGHFTGTLEELHNLASERDRFIYFDRFMKWRNTFGNQFALHPMIREELVQNCVVRDFLTFTFEGSAFQMIKEPNSNESLSLEDLAMLRELHLAMPGKPKFKKARIAVGLNFSRFLAALPREKHTKPKMHKSLVAGVMEKYQDDAQKLDAEFFEGSPMMDALRSAKDKSVDCAQSVLAEDHFNRDELRMIHAWSDLIVAMFWQDPTNLPDHLRGLHRRKLAGSGRLLNKTSKQSSIDKVALYFKGKING